MNSLLEWLKLHGINTQIDLGNASVGLATMIIALVSLYVAFTSIRATNRHRIGEFRREWLDDLRERMALHSEFCHSLILTRVSKEVDRNIRLTELYPKIIQNESYIRLKLNPGEEIHFQLMQEIVLIRRCLNKLNPGLSEDETTVLFKEYEVRRIKFINLSAQTLKTEWDRIKDEIHGRRSVARWLKHKIRERTIRKLEWKAVPYDDVDSERN